MVDGVLGVYERYWAVLLQAAEPTWEHIDVTTAQLKCLMVLEARGVLPMGRIASILGMSRSYTSITIDQLVQRGLVSRTEDLRDRRCTNASLTPEGRCFIQRFHRGDENFMRGCFERLDKADLVALGTGLAALTQAISDTAE